MQTEAREQTREAWLQSLKVGDEVAMISAYSRKFIPEKITRVTPAYLFIGRSRFDKDSGNCSDYQFLYPNTPEAKAEHLAKIDRRNRTERICKEVTNMATDDDLAIFERVLGIAEQEATDG